MNKHSFRTEREFGLVVGSASLLLGGWWSYRGKFAGVSLALILVGIALIVLGLVLPKALVYPNKAWMMFASVLGVVVTHIVLAIVFFLIVTPIGVIKRLSGWDPLRRRTSPSASYWHSYSTRQRDKHHYEKMY